MRIRQGNDFIFLWTIVRNGIPEDLGNAKNIKLHFKNFDCIGEVESFQIVDGNIVRVEVAPEWASKLGAYRLILSYEFETDSYTDGDRKCVVDVLAFNIVPKTSEADDLTEVTETTDIMIGFFGLSAYEVWLKDNPGGTKEDYYNWLRQPATDAGASISELEGEIQVNEGLRVSAENERDLAEGTRIQSENVRISNENNRLSQESTRVSQENTRLSQESGRVSAESSRVTAESGRVTAENNRVNAENLRESAESDRVELYGDMIQLKTDTITAKNDANEQAQYAKDMGDYAKEQGEIAETFINNWIKNW